MRLLPFVFFRYQAVSQYPQCINDISFWLPEKGVDPSDLYEIVRSVGGDIIEQVNSSTFFLQCPYLTL